MNNMLQFFGVLVTTNVLFIVLLFVVLWVWKGSKTAAKYLKNVALTYDQLLNTTIGGDPDETLSSVFGKSRNSSCGPCKWFSNIICYWLDKLDKQHCSDAIEKSEGGRSIWKPKENKHG